MASGATFHAKITADAREFIAQVEGAQEALKGLIQETKGAGKAGKTGQASNVSKAKKEQKTAQQQAMRSADDLHQKEMQNIKKENEARKDFFRQFAGGDAAKGARLTTGGFAKELEEERKLRRQYSKIQQKEEARAVRIEKQKQLQYEREIANLNRQQLDAMVTGRYALYDMANAYQQIATNAFRVTRAVASTVMVAAEFESAFTSFERAAGLQEGTDAFAYMRDVLKDLSTQIPITFEQLSEIATLGAQMGVATGDIANFTETIAKFSSITGATIDETAEKFGRLSALANIPVQEFENLASAVIYAGFNAVATEQEILAMSESIAAAASNAGYTGKQVVGLATALSSLGIPLERARGSILRIFGNITRAIDGGSDKLEAFANAAGVSADKAQYLWKESPEEFFTALLDGLGTVENLTLALDELGIVNTREVDVIQRLSQNMDVYNQSLREAANAYEENTALADIYAKTADNLETKIQNLVNAFDAFKATASEATAEAIKPAIDLLIDLTRAATEFSKSGLGAFAIPAIGGISAFVAAVAAIQFISKLATAQLLAMRVAILKTAQPGVIAGNVFKGLKNAITGNMYVTDALTGRTQFLTKATIENAAATGLLDKKLAADIIQKQKATIATRALSASMSILGGVMAAVTIASIVGMIVEMNNLNNAAGQNVGGAEALAEAIQKDTTAYNAGEGSIARYTQRINKNSDAAKANADGSRYVVDAQGNIKEAVIDSTDEIIAQTAALGENFRQLVLQDLVRSEPAKKVFEELQKQGTDFNELIDALGLQFDDFIQAAARDPEGAYSLFRKSLQETAKDTSALTPEIADVVNQLAALDRSPFGDPLSQFTATGLGALNRFSQDLGIGAERSDIFTDEVVGLNSSLREFFRILQTNTTVGMNTYDMLVQNGLATTDNTAALIAHNEEMANGAEENESFAKSLRTILDYSSDVVGVLQRIQQIEFGTTEAEDDIADAWEKIGERADKAREAIEAANNEINELTADRAVLEYQLSVAERYGDERRAMQIRAKLGEVDSKLADESEKLAEAQDEVSMTLEGQTKAARENREVVDGLVGSYINLIEAAIESGMRGEELEKYIESLKEEFYANGEAVGYSRDELSKYAELFDQFKTAVREIDPRIDVQFNTNLSAVQNALNEFKAKLDSTAGVYKTKIEVELPDPRQLYPIISRASELSLGSAFMGGRINARQYYMAVYGIDLNNYKYAAGGFVSGPGTPTSDSIPAMLSNGEYVIQAKAVSSYGVDFMNAINQQRVPMTASAPASAAVSGGSTIAYLAPEDRALLRSVADRPVTLYADNTKIAQSANAGNQTLSQRGLK